MNRKAFRIALLIFGVFCGSTAVIMIKSSNESPFLIAAYRLFIATLVLSPLFLQEKKRFPQPYGRKQFGWSVLPGVLLSAHFITWNIGVPMTMVSNASLIVNTTPVVMPFFLWLFYREKVTRREVLGTSLAISGLLVLALSKSEFSLASLKGDLIILFSMLCLAAYLALGRKNGSRLPVWLYIVPLYLVAGLTSFGVALFFVDPIKTYTAKNLLLILGLALIPTIGGHTILNFSMKHFRGQVVSVANLGQVIFASIMGFIVFGEVPAAAFYLTAALIISGVLVTLTANAASVKE